MTRQPAENRGYSGPLGLTVPRLFYRGVAGQKGVCRANPALTDNERVRFAVADIALSADEARVQDSIKRERQAVTRLHAAIATIEADLDWYWHWSDGQGGFVLDELRKAVKRRGHSWPYDAKPKPEYSKAKISRSLSKRVMERDAYRCVTCNTHIDLCCDHIVPESKGGETTFANLQTMCRPCNSRKGSRQP